MARVTIITPTYNRASFLEETVESIAAQDWPDLEHIIVDDGSRDETPALLERLRTRHPFLRVVRQDNGGEPVAVNHGWRLATGDYVCVVNSDDPQPPSLVARSVAALERRPDVIVSYPDWYRIGAGGEILDHVETPEHSPLRMILDAECYVGPGAFIRRGLVRSPRLRDPRFRHASDFACWLDLLFVAPFLRIPEPIGAWRQHPAAATQAARRGLLADELVSIIFELFERADLPRAIRANEHAAKRNALRHAVDLCRGRSPRDHARFRLQLLAYQSPAEVRDGARRLVRRALRRLRSRLATRATGTDNEERT